MYAVVFPDAAESLLLSDVGVEEVVERAGESRGVGVWSEEDFADESEEVLVVVREGS